MDAERICPHCHKPLAPEAPRGLCPECLLKAGLGTGAEIGPESQGPAGSEAARFVPPPVEELGRFFPQLEIIELLGRGGMGAVYKARQKQLNRLVALKILPPAVGSTPAFAERFTREAQALAQLNHPGIVTLYEFGQADGLFYFLMEFVDGVGLRKLLEVGRISPREALAIVPQICEALQYAHDHGVVHRDIKPENILLNREGRVKIADFGVARIMAQETVESAFEVPTGPPSTMTEAGKVVGTPPYMAPEQFAHPLEVDHRADIFSLGVVFYEMLTGQLPEDKLVPPSSRARGMRLDVRLDEVVLRALEKEPERRYQKADDVKTRVETIAGTQTDPSTAGLELKKPKRLSLSVWMSTVALVLLAFSVWSNWQGRRARAAALEQKALQSNVQPAQGQDATSEEVRATSVQEWFARFENPSPNSAPFTPLRALIAKAAESDQIRDQIIQLASKTIDDAHANMATRWQCCYVLSGIHDTNGIPPIIRALKDANETVRGCAACALGAFLDSPEAKAALEEAATNEKSAPVQDWIRKALDGEFRK